MVDFRRVFLSLLLSLLATPAFAGTGCENLPEDWFGRWETHVVQRDCATGLVTQDTVIPDRLCSSDCFNASGNGSMCTTTLQGASVVIECETKYENWPGCQSVLSYEYVYDLVDGSFSGGGTAWLVNSDGCPSDLVDICTNVELTATRLQDATACQVATAPTTWGLVKGSYR